MKESIIKNITLVLIIIILLVIGIYFLNKLNPSSGKLICTYNNVSDTIETSFKYKVNFKDRNVTTLESIEQIKSSDKELLNNYKESLTLMYDKYKDLQYYNNKIVLKDDTLTTTTKINYDKININKYLTIDSNNKNLVKNNKISIKKVKEIYLKNGAKCKYN